MAGRLGRRAELHLHLEGTIGAETLRQLDPALTNTEIREALSYSDFDGFIQSYVWVNRKLQTPEHYALVARNLFARLAADDVCYAEITLSAGVILWKQQSLSAVFDVLAREAADSPVPVRWIFDVTRQWGSIPAIPVFDFAAERVRDGVVGVGLGGFEAFGPATWFRRLFAEARERGLHLTCHAGETTNAQSVWDAVNIGAERIGHGIRAAEDPKLLSTLAERQIPLEICLSSNVRTGAVASIEEHPIRRIYDAGVPIVLDTDDPDLFECSLDGEFEIAARMFGFSEAELAGIAENSLRFAFDLPAQAAEVTP